MISSRFIYILNALNKEDFKLLGRYLYSPIHNSNKNLIKLYQTLKHFYPVFDAKKFDMEVLHKKIFPGKTFNEKIIRNLIYEFTDLIKCFLAYLNYSRNSFAYQRHLLEELNSRKLDRFVKDNIKRADEIVSEQIIRDDIYYSNRVFLEEMRYLHEIKEVPMGKSLVLSNIKKEYVKNASSYFILVILKEYFEKKNRDEHIKSDFEIKLAENLFEFLKTEIEYYKDEPAIYLLYQYLKLGEETAADEYFLLKALTIKNKDKIAETYFKDFILDLYNYCKIKERKGDTTFGNESFELIKYMGENNLLLEADGNILEHNYTNTVATAIRQKDVEWALTFIDKYKNKIPENIRENAYNYNMATVNYIISTLKNNDCKLIYLEKAHNFLSKVKTSDFYYTTRINNLELLIYYEKNDLEPMFSLIDAYRHFLHSNKLIPDTIKNRYSNFINFMNRLINIKSGSKHSSVERLKLDIMKAETEYKKWLLDKTEELEELCTV